MQVGGVTFVDPPDGGLSPQYDWLVLGLVAALYITGIVYGLRNRR